MGVITHAGFAYSNFIGFSSFYGVWLSIDQKRRTFQFRFLYFNTWKYFGYIHGKEGFLICRKIFMFVTSLNQPNLYTWFDVFSNMILLIERWSYETTVIEKALSCVPFFRPQIDYYNLYHVGFMIRKLKVSLSITSGCPGSACSCSACWSEVSSPVRRCCRRPLVIAAIAVAALAANRAFVSWIALIVDNSIVVKVLSFVHFACIVLFAARINPKISATFANCDLTWTLLVNALLPFAV